MHGRLKEQSPPEKKKSICIGKRQQSSLGTILHYEGKKTKENVFCPKITNYSQFKGTVLQNRSTKIEDHKNKPKRKKNHSFASELPQTLPKPRSEDKREQKLGRLKGQFPKNSIGKAKQQKKERETLNIFGRTYICIQTTGTTEFKSCCRSSSFIRISSWFIWGSILT